MDISKPSYYYPRGNMTIEQQIVYSGANRMKLKQLTLENYRCYQNLCIELHPQLTVLVANNGQGKTTILDAIRIVLWPYVSQFDLARPANVDPAFTLAIKDIRIVKANGMKAPNSMARQIPAAVSALGDYSNGEISWSRKRDSEAAKSQTKDDKGCRTLRAFAKALQQQVRELTVQPITLPVFGYYGTGRLWQEKRQTESKTGVKPNDQHIRTFAYRDCLDSGSNYRQFEAWFISMSKKVFEYQIQQLQQGLTAIEVDPEIMAPLTAVRNAVNEVLKTVGWQHLEFSQRDNESLVLRHEEYGIMSVDQLSDGIKNVIAMVGDIAYRIVLLNGHLGEDAVQQTAGIVMIDEVDMHLHPMWQQKIIESLLNAFPKIQFIVTTHSPQVLSTVAVECIRLINHEVDPTEGLTISTAIPPTMQSKGVASADVMASLQLVDPVPDVVEAQWLTEYKQLIVQNAHEGKEGNALSVKIIRHFGESHQEWLECKRLIRLQAMKSKLPSLKQKD